MLKNLLLGSTVSLFLAGCALATPVCDNLLPNNCIKPNSNGSVNIGTSATSNPPVSLQLTTTASAVQLSSNTLTNGIIFEIPSTDTGTICVGLSSITTSNSFCMSIASGIVSGSLGVNNTNLVYILGTNTTDKLMVLGN